MKLLLKSNYFKFGIELLDIDDNLFSERSSVVSFPNVLFLNSDNVL